MARNPIWDDTLPDKGRAAIRRATDAQKEEALKHATQFLDTLPFKGERLTTHQSLSWPRKGVFRDDGAPVLGVPPEIMEATSMVASFILAGIPYDTPAVAHVFALIGHLIEEQPRLTQGKVTWH